MAPRMLRRGGAALLCLSVLLALGKCRGADSRVRMRRSPPEGRRGDRRKATPHPRTRSSSYLQPPSASAGAEESRPAPGAEPGPGIRGLGSHSGPFPMSKKGANPSVRGRVRPRGSMGIRGIHSPGPEPPLPALPPPQPAGRGAAGGRGDHAGPRPWLAGWCGAAPPAASLPAAAPRKEAGCWGSGAAAARPPAVL